jgi:hypothetical protein
MANYKVNYKNSDKKVYIEADSPRHAYIKFLEQSDIHEKPVLVTSESTSGSIPQTETFSDHETLFTVKTQLDILSQLKQINWAIRIGFLFIMLVVSGIIKPGIFG